MFVRLCGVLDYQLKLQKPEILNGQAEKKLMCWTPATLDATSVPLDPITTPT